MTSKSQEFFSLVKHNKMHDAKKVFETVMKTKMVEHVSSMRKVVAEKLFAKK